MRIVDATPADIATLLTALRNDPNGMRVISNIMGREITNVVDGKPEHPTEVSLDELTDALVQRAATRTAEPGPSGKAN